MRYDAVSGKEDIMKFSKRFKENIMLIAFGVLLFFALMNYELALDLPEDRRKGTGNDA